PWRSCASGRPFSVRGFSRPSRRRRGPLGRLPGELLAGDAEGLAQGHDVEPSGLPLAQLPLDDSTDGHAGGIGHLLSRQPGPLPQLADTVAKLYLLPILL